MADYANFRQRLDAVLRTLDVKQASEFLIAEDQWKEGPPPDPEYAMWMMIAGSPALRDLHEQARQWLVSHGHEAEANAVLGKSRAAGPGGKQRKGGRHGERNQGGRGRSGRKASPYRGGQRP